MSLKVSENKKIYFKNSEAGFHVLLETHICMKDFIKVVETKRLILVYTIITDNVILNTVKETSVIKCQNKL